MNAVAAANALSLSLRITDQRAAESAEDWLDNVPRLYLLSFLLTSDKVLADNACQMQWRTMPGARAFCQTGRAGPENSL